MKSLLRHTPILLRSYRGFSKDGRCLEGGASYLGHVYLRTGKSANVSILKHLRLPACDKASSSHPPDFLLSPVTRLAAFLTLVGGDFGKNQAPPAGGGSTPFMFSSCVLTQDRNSPHARGREIALIPQLPHLCLGQWLGGKERKFNSVKKKHI